MIELRLLKGRSVKLNLKHNIVHTLLSFSLLVFTTFSVADEPATQSAEALQAKADALGKQTFKRKNGQVLRYEEIAKLKESVQNVIFDEMTDEEANRYGDWLSSTASAANARIAEMDKTHEAQLARIAEKNKHHEAQLARGAELNKELIFKYNLYLNQVEEEQLGVKKFLNDLVDFEKAPEPLKQRARALLANKNIKWKD